MMLAALAGGDRVIEIEIVEKARDADAQTPSMLFQDPKNNFPHCRTLFSTAVQNYCPLLQSKFRRRLSSFKKQLARKSYAKGLCVCVCVCLCAKKTKKTFF